MGDDMGDSWDRHSCKPTNHWLDVSTILDGIYQETMRIFMGKSC